MKNWKMRLWLVKKQLKSIMENLPMKILRIFNGFINFILHKNTYLANQRYNICKQCENLIILDDIEYCNICGCMIKLKTTV